MSASKMRRDSKKVQRQELECADGGVGVKDNAMVIAVDSSITPVCTNLDTLCHSQLVQALLVNMLSLHTEWCPRFAEFQAAVSSLETTAGEIEECSGEEFISYLAPATGSNHLPEKVLSSHAELWDRSVQDCSRNIQDPQMLLTLLTKFIETCFPRTDEEWLELACKARSVQETRHVIDEITDRIIRAIESSDKAELVAVNLLEVKQRSPEVAFVLCLNILSDFVGLNTIARPTPSEVRRFAQSYGYSFPQDDERQRMQLSTMLLFHPSNEGVRQSRRLRENPFAFVVRKRLASSPDPIPFVPEINAEGRLTGLRVSEEGESPSSDATVDRLRAIEHLPQHELPVAGTHQGEKPSNLPLTEPTPVSRQHHAEATPEHVEKVRQFILAYRGKHQGEDPTVKSIRKGVRFAMETVCKCLDVLRITGEWTVPKHKRGSERTNRKKTKE